MNEQDLLAMQQQANSLGDTQNLESIKNEADKTIVETQVDTQGEQDKALKILEQHEKQFEDNADENTGNEAPTETPAETIARLQRELEEARQVKEPEVNPLKSVEDRASAKGIDIDDLVAEYASTGELSQASKEALNKAGFDDVAIEAYKEARLSIETKKAVDIMNRTVGSEENYGKLVEWITTNKTQQEIDVFNKAVTTEYVELAIKAMHQEMLSKTSGQNVQQKPQLIRGTPSASAGEQGLTPFRSEAEMIKAMQDGLYGSDKNYTEMVRKRTALMYS